MREVAYLREKPNGAAGFGLGFLELFSGFKSLRCKTFRGVCRSPADARRDLQNAAGIDSGSVDRASPFRFDGGEKDRRFDRDPMRWPTPGCLTLDLDARVRASARATRQRTVKLDQSSCGNHPFFCEHCAPDDTDFDVEAPIVLTDPQVVDDLAPTGAQTRARSAMNSPVGIAEPD
jgi:hypothetical protein